MPRVRPIHQLMSSSLLAVEESGMQRAVMSVIASTQQDQSLIAFLQAEAQTEAKDRWTEFLISTGLYPYYINPDGRVVSSLAEDAKDLIQQGAIAVVPIKGILVKEAWTLEELWYGLVSAERITKAIKTIAADSRVIGAIATVDSPGGMVAGTEKMSNAWLQLGSVKPTIAHVDGLAASAAYWFSSGSGRIMLDCRTAYTGSIGVMTSFWDWTALYEAWGAKYYEIYAPESEKKNEEYRKLRGERDTSGFRDRLSVLARLFREHVTSTRGSKLNASEPEVLQGRVYAGDASIAVGLADGFGELDDCITLLRAATPTEGAPAEAHPSEQIAPVIDDDGDHDDASSNQPKTMNLKTMLAAFVATFFSAKEEIKQADIDAANTELTEKDIKGVALVSTEEQARIANAAASIQAADNARASAELARTTAEEQLAAVQQQLTEAQASLNAATERASAMENALRSSATKAGLTIADDANVAEAVGAALEETTASLTAARAEIAELKGDKAPAGDDPEVVNDKGDEGHQQPNAIDSWLKEE